MELKNTIAISKKNFIQLNTKLTKTDSLCQYYKSILNEKEI